MTAHKKKNIQTAISLFVFPLSLLTQVAYSSEETRDDDTSKKTLNIAYLEKVIVTAMKDNHPIETSGASLAHYSIQDIERNNAISLGDVLRYEPGVNVDENHDGSISNIRIRGVGDDRVLILVDGAPLPSSYQFGTYLNTNRDYFDIDAMKSIEIIKGPMSTLYGSSALAGGIFMQTKDPVDFLKEGQRYGGETKVSYNGANNGMLWSGTMAGIVNDKVSGFVRLTLKKHYETINYHGRAFDESKLGDTRKYPNSSETNTKNILTKWIFEPNSNHKFSVSYERFNENSHTNVLSSITSTSFGTYKNWRSDVYDRTRRQQFNFRHDFEAPNVMFDRGFWQVYAQNNKVRQEYFELRNNIRTTRLDSRDRIAFFNNKRYGLNAEFSKYIESNNITHDITYGISMMENRITTNRTGNTFNVGTGMSVETEPFPNKSFPDTKVRELGAFLQDRIGFFKNKLEVIPGIRYDHYKLNPKQGTAFETANEGVLPPESISKGQLSKRLAILYSPWENHTFFVNYSEGFKAPSFSSINVGFSNPAIGYTSRSNPNLKSEKSRMYELGWNYVDDKQSYAITGFYTNYDNFIEELHMVGVDPVSKYMIFQAINLDKSAIYGIEAKASMEVLEILNGRGSIRLDGNIAYAKGRVKHGKDPIDSVEPLTGMLGISYSQDDKLYVGLRWKLVQAKKEKNISEQSRELGVKKMPGFGTVDLIAEYKPLRDVTINAGIYNVLNKQRWSWGNRMSAQNEYAINRNSSPGINAGLSVKINF